MSRPTKIAIPIWQDSVSTVFDFASKLLLIDVQERQETKRSEIILPDELMPHRVARLKSLGVDTLICGAISRPLAFMVMASEIEVLPYVSGQIDEVLQAYIAGRLTQPQFLQPGCRPGARKRLCRGWGRGRGRGWRRGQR